MEWPQQKTPQNYTWVSTRTRPYNDPGILSSCYLIVEVGCVVEATGKPWLLIKYGEEEETTMTIAENREKKIRLGFYVYWFGLHMGLYSHKQKGIGPLRYVSNSKKKSPIVKEKIHK